MALTLFYSAAAIAVLLLGAGAFWALWQLAAMLKQIRQDLLPQVEQTLAEVQKNLAQIEALTQEVDQTVEEANQIVQTANRTLQTVEDGIETFTTRVAAPAAVRVKSAWEGARVAWKTYRAKRHEARREAEGEFEARAPEAVETP